MAFCRECGKKLQENAKFCPDCGTPVNSVPPKKTVQKTSVVRDSTGNGASIFSKAINGVLEITTENGEGSGFLIDKKGYAITNCHVVTENGEPCDEITVKVADENVRAFIIELGDVDDVDLALIKLSRVPKNATPLLLGDFDSVKTGEEIFVIGNSQGDGTCITRGIVSDRLRDGMMMTDAATNPGNSGGPVLNEDGLVIGVHTSHRTGADGMKFAIPVFTVKDFLTEVCNYKIQQPSVVGASVQGSSISVDQGEQVSITPPPIVTQSKKATTFDASAGGVGEEPTPIRKEFYDGEVHKCPHCGEPLDAFVVECPSCHKQIRGSRGSSAIRDLSERLVAAETDKQRIIIIKNFPIPNTKEDIFEFMMLASSNFDSSYYATHLHEEDMSDAWLIKVEQCYKKAKLMFGNDPDFEKIEAEYLKLKKEISDQESKVRYERKAQETAQQREESSNIFKKSKFKIVLIIFSIIAAVFIAVAFNDGKVAAGAIGVVMLAAFIVSFLMGLNVIKEKVRKMHLIPAIIGFVLIIPYFALYSSNAVSPGESTKWDDIILHEYAPAPSMNSARVMTNSREEFYIYSIKCTQSEYYAYVNECKDFGYDYEIMEEDEYSYVAYNEDGYKLDISYISTLTVQLNAPMSIQTIEWPSSDIAKLIPQPESLKGKIEWEHDYGFVIYIADTTLDEYKAYVSAVQNCGFNVDYSKGDTYFWADNSDGYHVQVRYEGFNTMWIRLDEPSD